MPFRVENDIRPKTDVDPFSKTKARSSVDIAAASTCYIRGFKFINELSEGK